MGHGYSRTISPCKGTILKILLEECHLQTWITALSSYNGWQFIDKGFENFLQQLGIKQKVTSVKHPQTNGQAEATNKVTLNELKKKLSQAKGLWAEEIPRILSTPDFVRVNINI